MEKLTCMALAVQALFPLVAARNLLIRSACHDPVRLESAKTDER
jgi:hypothetical protein